MPESKRIEKDSVYPFQLNAGLLAWVARHRDFVEPITYSDLAWPKSRSMPESYNLEWQNWNESLRTKSRDPLRSYWLFQYDVDWDPKATESLLRIHLDLGIPANVMIFGEDTRAGYPIRPDVGLLREFQSIGGVIGYHSDAPQRAEGDAAKTRELFCRDVERLRELFTIEYFSPHSSNFESLSQQQIVSDDLLEELGIRWVHNYFAPSFQSAYSDGGTHNRFAAGQGDSLNLVQYARDHLIQPGRHRILLHPQLHSSIRFEQLSELDDTQGSRWLDDVRDQLMDTDSRAYPKTGTENASGLLCFN